jgi:hypothetical protein
VYVNRFVLVLCCVSVVWYDNDKPISNVDEGLSDSSQITIPGTFMKRGRPTTSRDKPPYEQPKKRTRFCTICKGGGHKSMTYLMRGDLPKPPRKLTKCSRCGVTGHLKNFYGNPVKPWKFLSYNFRIFPFICHLGYVIKLCVICILMVTDVVTVGHFSFCRNCPMKSALCAAMVMDNLVHYIYIITDEDI